MRSFDVDRKTCETDIQISLCLDGKGQSNIDTGIGFMDHMLTLFARHGGFDLDVKCVGDTYVDCHHSVEDLGIALGTALSGALGDKKGITRYGSVILPMDEALIISAVDISGRCHLTFDAEIPTEKVGDFDTELVKEFFLGFVRASAITLHIVELEGENSHHIIECMFKGVARALRRAVEIDRNFKDEIPSTKGVL